MFKFYFVLLSILFAGTTFSQTASQYSFATNATGSLVLDRNNNTVDMSSGTTQLVAANQNNASSGVIGMGFNFTFMGTVYTQFSASSNGAIRLGGTAIGATTVGNSFPVLNQPIIAPYWGDLETHSSNSKVHYKVVGDAPNRTLVVEFLNMRINLNSSTANGTFQARLYEQTNIIEFVYGAMAVGSTSTTGSTAANARTVAIGFSETTGANNQFSVNQSSPYNTSTTATRITNTNGSTGNIAGLNSSSNGSRRVFVFTPTLPYKSQFISMALPASFCAGSVQNVQVTVKNIGTATWTDAAPDVNIGAKWNADADYFYRVDAAGLAPGATQTFTIPVLVPAAGANNITFDVVREADCWFGNNNGSCGPGNLTYTSEALTILSNPTIALSSAAGTINQSKCINTAITNITYNIGGPGTGATVTGLPAGVTGTYNAGIFTISGTPTESGTFNYTVTTAGPCTNPTATGTITVNPASAISLSSAAGTNAQSICITNAIAPITYNIGGSATGASVTGLPAGVTGNYNAGVFSITGTPTVTGAFNYTVTATGTCPVSVNGSITINGASTIVLTSAAATTNQGRCINTAITNITYTLGTATGGSASGLPAGVTGTYSSGAFLISGTPTETGVFNYTITITGPCTGATASGTITVNALSTITLSSAAGTNAQLKCSADPLTPITYTIDGSSTGAAATGLPAGINGVYGAGVFTISGTATVTGVFNYTVTTTGPCPQSASGTITVYTNSTIGLSSAVATSNQTICLGASITNITYTTGGTTTGASATGLPAGVGGIYNAGVFTISGTPTLPGLYNYTVTTTGPCASASATGSITVNARPSATITSANTAICAGGSTTLSGTVTASGNWTLTLSNGGGTVTGNGPQSWTKTVSPGTATTYTISSLSDSKCASIAADLSGSTTVSINALPVAHAGANQQLCSSGISTIVGAFPSATGGSGGGYTYTWTGSGLASTSAANPTATPASLPSVYTLVVKDGNNCISASSSATVSLGTSTKSWIGEGNGGSGPNADFNNPQNWSPAGVPGSCNDVVMNVSLSPGFLSSETANITFSDNATIKSLTTKLDGTSLLGAATFRLNVGTKQLNILNNTLLQTNGGGLAATFETQVAVGAGGVVIYGGNLNTSGTADYNIVKPFLATSNNNGKFYLKGNATLANNVDDAGTKPAQVIFDGTGTQTITNNSGGETIMFGATTTDIGETNSPVVVLAGNGSGGFNSIGNLRVNNTATLDMGTQPFNRRTNGGTFSVANGATLELAGGTGGQTGSNFPAGFTTITLQPTSTTEYKGTAAQTVYATTYGHLIVSNNATKTAGGVLTVKGNLTINASAVLNGSTFSHVVAGNWVNNVGSNAFTSTGTVSLNGVTPQTIGGTAAAGTVFNNLTISNATGVGLLQSQKVATTLTLSSGILNIGSNNLTMGTAANAVAGTFSATRMILASGSGEVRKEFASNGTYAFPLGDNTSVTEYSPVTISATGSGYASAYIGVNVTDAKHASNFSPVNYITRYWNVTQSGITGCAVNLSAGYTAADISGTESAISSAQLKGIFNQANNGWVKFQALGAHTLTANGATLADGQINVFSGISGANPSVSVTGGDVSICLGSGGTPLSTSVTGDPSFLYSWTPSAGLSAANIANPVATPLATTTYTVTARDANGVPATANVTVTVNEPADIAAQPTDATICNGNAVSFHVSASGTGITYQWQVSPDGIAPFTNITGAPYTGYNTDALGIATPSVAMNGYSYRVVITGAAPCGNITSSVGKLGIKNTWTGNSSNNWNDAANWSGNVLPDNSCGDVYITAQPNQPLLSSGTATINNLVIQTGAALTVSNAVLQLSGSITNNGIFDIAQGTLELNGTTDQAISGNMFQGKNIGTLINSNPVAITVAPAPADTLRILNELLFGAVTNSVTKTNDNLTLVSTAAATARAGAVVGGNSITGNVTVERYISAGRKWRLLSVPANTTQSFKQSWMENTITAAGNPAPGYGMQITDNHTNWASNGFDNYSPGGPSLKIFNPVTGSYEGIPNTGGQVNTTLGYMAFVRGDRSAGTVGTSVSQTVLRLKGPLKQGTQSAVIVPATKFGTVGNPYASAIDIRNINRTGTTGEIYVWDPSLTGSYGLGAFQTLAYNSSTGNYETTPGQTVYNYIQSGQAFFVRATAGDGTVTFEENDKASGSTSAGVFFTQGMAQQLRADLYLANSGNPVLMDGIMADFAAENSNDVNYGDALKMANTSENVGLKRDNNLLVIERRKEITANDTLFLNLTGLRAQTYQWQLNASNMDAPGRTGWLVDRFTNTRTPLELAGLTTINFTVTSAAASSAANRFIIVFTPGVVLPVTMTDISAIRNRDKTATVNWTAATEINMEHYIVERSTDGYAFSETGAVLPRNNNSGSATYSFIDNTASTGVNFYRIRAVSIGGQVQYSATVKVDALKETIRPVISVYPNPVVDKKMNLSFKDCAEGEYTVELISAGGQVVYRGRINVNSSNVVKMVKLDNVTAGGLYNLRAVGKDGNVFTTRLMIE